MPSIEILILIDESKTFKYFAVFCSLTLTKSKIYFSSLLELLCSGRGYN